MKIYQGLAQPGVIAALGSALLFGASTPLAGILLHSVSPWMLAGLLYLGSGIGLALYRYFSAATKVRLKAEEISWLAGAMLAGGVFAPVLLMFGLAQMQISSASLLLNTEGIFTSLLAWVVFRENVSKRIATGMAFILTGAILLSWSPEARITDFWPSLLVLGACLCWGIDNNLTRKLSLLDSTWVAMVKGSVAGCINLSLALLLGEAFPPLLTLFIGMTVGFFAYGISLSLFVTALRYLGTARTGAYFSFSPF